MKRLLASLVMVNLMVTGPGFVRAIAAQPALWPLPPATQGPGQATDVTPPRVSYVTGEVSFWRAGAQDWGSARLNIPLAPGDILYAGQSATVEVQIGPAAYLRATDGSQIGLDNQETDFIQFRVMSGHAALDLRQLAPGSTVELSTPNATFTIERPGYYHVDIDHIATAFSTRRGGSATMTTMGGAATVIAANQQVVVTGGESAGDTMRPAPPLTAWDRWSYERTEQLLRPASSPYVPPAVYGAEALDQYGTWRAAEAYGPVWVPAGVPAGWVPYSTGRWIWDPRFGWTWLDDAPWGWAPYHYGRWVFIHDYWAWTPGPIVVRPIYAPALVVFLGGVSVVRERPVCWAPLAWGEPVIPWWGRPGFIGVPHWAGWGGPRVVNNIVIDRSTTIHVTNITAYRNVNMANAVVGIPAEHFGRGHARATRLSHVEIQGLRPVHGAPDVRPVAASVLPAFGHAIRPPADIQARSVVATRPPKDWKPTLHAHGLAPTPEAPRGAASRLVPSPQSMREPRGWPTPGTPGAMVAPGRTPSGAPGGPEVQPAPKRAPGRLEPLPTPHGSPQPGGPQGPRPNGGPDFPPEPRRTPGTPQGVPPQSPGWPQAGGPQGPRPNGGLHFQPEPRRTPGAPQMVPPQSPGSPQAGRPRPNRQVGPPEAQPEPRKSSGDPQGLQPPSGSTRTPGPEKKDERARRPASPPPDQS